MTTRYERLSARSRRLEVIAAVAAAVFAVVTCRLAPEPAAGAGSPTADVGYVANAAEAGWPGVSAALPHAAPVHVRIAGTGVAADVLPSRKAGKGLPAAPPDDPMQVAWDTAGPTPGRPGTAVLVGHRDSVDGPAAFAGLGGLRAGTRIAVGRADGRTARFVAYAVERYGKDGLPDGLRHVHASGGEVAQLWLVASGGTWTKDAADDMSVVVFAHAARG